SVRGIIPRTPREGSFPPRPGSAQADVDGLSCADVGGSSVHVIVNEGFKVPSAIVNPVNFHGFLQHHERYRHPASETDCPKPGQNIVPRHSNQRDEPEILAATDNPG